MKPSISSTTSPKGSDLSPLFPSSLDKLFFFFSLALSVFNLLHLLCTFGDLAHLVLFEFPRSGAWHQSLISASSGLCWIHTFPLTFSPFFSFWSLYTHKFYHSEVQRGTIICEAVKHRPGLKPSPDPDSGTSRSVLIFHADI